MLPGKESFLCTLDDLDKKIARIDPDAYDKSRNYLDGAVTWLGPFLTHGISTTSEIAERVSKNRKPADCYRLLFELAWREYFHRTWQRAGDGIFDDMRESQASVASKQIPRAIVDSKTGIDAIDRTLRGLYDEGLMHNHARMWTASLICNMAQTAWYEPARYMHYHLLDGDLASNTLSWQWVAGTFSHKRYFANQDNINKYSRTTQSDTWLDIPYEAFEHFDVPAALSVRTETRYDEQPPGVPIKPLSGDVALRSMWQLNPRWQSGIETHIVFIDTQWLSKWPVSPNRKAFIEHWATMCNAPVVYGTLQDLNAALTQATVIREEYPACKGWPGTVVERQWLYPEPEQPYNSFSRYFKQVKSHVGL